MGSTHVVEQFSIIFFLSFLTFDFDLILGSFLLLGTRVFLGLGKGSQTVFGYIYVVDQLSFSMLPSILISDFDLILGSFFTFWGGVGFKNCHID